MATYEVTTTEEDRLWYARITKNGRYENTIGGKSEKAALAQAARWIAADQLPKETRRYLWNGMELVKKGDLHDVVGSFTEVLPDAD